MHSLYPSYRTCFKQTKQFVTKIVLNKKKQKELKKVTDVCLNLLHDDA